MSNVYQMTPLEALKAPGRYSIVGGPFGSKLVNRDYVPDGVPVIRGGNLPSGVRFSFDDLVFVTEEKVESDLFGNLAFPGDIVVTQRGTLGQVGIIPESSPYPKFVVSQSQMKLTVDRSKAYPIFVYYALRSPLGQQEIHSRAMTAGVPHINLSLFRQLQLPNPPLDVQRKIAAILSAYDDLIENNNRRIKILEEMAQHIYREWFVDYRYPGHEDIPLVDSELGTIPEGWAVHRLGDDVEFVYGKALKADARRVGPVVVFGSGGAIGHHDEALSQGPGIVVGRKGNVGSVYWSDDAFFAIDTTYWIRSCLPLTYCYYVLRDMDFLDSHAAVPGLSREQAYSLPLLVPDPAVGAKFQAVARNIFALRRSIKTTAHNLRTTRDLLLPRLISGEIDVSDVDFTMSEAVT